MAVQPTAVPCCVNPPAGGRAHHCRQERAQHPVKQRIGAMAASLVQPGCRLILDSGTTTLEVARHPRDHQEIVMTNGMNVANALLEAEGWNC